MHYIILTKLEYPTSVTLRVKGLRKKEGERLSQILSRKKINFTNVDTSYLEADLSGVDMLNLLTGCEFGYKVVTQAMAMELSSLGGRSFQIEKVSWTLERAE